MSAIAWLPPPVGFTDDAMLQAWVKDLHEHILAAGLVQTEDTGQIDPETVTLPSVTTTIGRSPIGHFIYRFTDALQDARPVFIKLLLMRLGTSAGSCLGSHVWAGSGTDGAGGLTGVFSDDFSTLIRTTSVDTAPVVQGVSRICFNAGRGFFGLSFCSGNHSFYSSYGFFYAPVAFFLSRTQAPDGAPTAEGFSLYARNQEYYDSSAYNTNGVNFNNVGAMFSQTLGDVVSDPTQYAFPYLPIPGALDGEILALRAYHVFDDAKPVPDYNLVAVPIAQTLGGQEFEMVSGGTEAHNFITLETAAALKPQSINNLYTPAMLWE